MKELMFLVVFLCASQFILANEASPKVQVYSRNPGQFGKENVLICHVTGFHPPEIKIDLLKNQREIPDAKQTDLAFEESWKYHLTKHASFTPTSGDTYVCKVTHMGKTTDYVWEPDM